MKWCRTTDDRTELKKKSLDLKVKDKSSIWCAALVLYLQSADPLGSITDSQQAVCHAYITHAAAPLYRQSPPSFPLPPGRGKHETSSHRLLL